ncbi:hypothetical protein Bca52824_096474 [Brassica carinata]|uniref:Uncharacterized protein n=1 Tax=Brassica carinata TaxID=52824 RepID=A0A8X7TGS9_BRACI|nr:hypothetical protein Bca52824_096474 [Brassica carinata]
MAGFSFSCCWCLINPPILFSLPSESPLFLLPATRRRGGKIGELVVSNAHSNPKIINPKKKSRYGQTLSPYDSDEEAELDDESDDDDDDWLLNDDFAEVTEYENNKPKSQKTTIAKKGVKKEAVKSWETDEEDDISITRKASDKNKKIEKDSWRLDGRGKVKY